MSGLKIVTTHVYPPIPVRCCDWSAVIDNYDGEGSPIGRGATEAEAIADLCEKLDIDVPGAEPCCLRCDGLGEWDWRNWQDPAYWPVKCPDCNGTGKARAVLSTPLPIDAAYAEINALGGYVSPRDVAGQASAETLDKVLAILERHGAMDPASRALARSEAAAQELKP